MGLTGTETTVYTRHVTTVEFLSHQVADGRFQLEKIFAGLTDDQWNARLTPGSMTPLETAIHLSDCYVALGESVDGLDHEWGSFTLEDKSPANVEKVLFELRDSGVAKALEKADERSLKALSEYVALHDAYHVGQLASLRLSFGDGWDPYSIYNM